MVDWDGLDDATEPDAGTFEDAGFCACGVVDELDDGLCRICAGAPHGRECTCEDCTAYWEGLTVDG